MRALRSFSAVFATCAPGCSCPRRASSAAAVYETRQTAGVTSGSSPAMRVWASDRPVPVGSVLSSLRRGPGDPCYRVQQDGVVGPAPGSCAGGVLLRLRARPAAGEVVAHAWGPGAQAALDGVPALLGGA